MSRPFRYTFILATVAVAVGLAAAGGWRYARASAPVSGPIIVISIDALRADHLPAYGYKNVRTPAIDVLAADGVVFERAYSHAPQTLPAHVAMLSGRLPFETGVRDDVGATVRKQERLLPQMLRDRGFATGGVVSAYVLRKETGIAQGFDFFDGAVPAPPDVPSETLARDGMQSEALAENWLGNVRTSRTFLFLHIHEPHKPYAPPDRFAEYAPYDGEIAYADDIVGRFVKYLKSHQLYDRSTIILVSDHGEGLGDHGEQEHGLFVYDEAIHVPLIVKQEGNAGAGRRVANVVQHIDLVPTILELVKAPVPSNLRGRSLKPVLEGSGGLRAASVYSEAMYGRIHFGWSGLTALTDDRYRYINAPREELYDLRRDGERENIAGDAPKVRQAMKTTLLERFTPPAKDGERADPKDKVAILETYRTALDAAGEYKWTQAIGLLQQVTREEPEIPGIWQTLAAWNAQIDRFDRSLDAYRHDMVLAPSDPEAYLGAARALWRLKKFKDAREQAAIAIDVADAKDTRSRGIARELLARIAIASHDYEQARAEAMLAEEADATTPMSAFVEGRILYEQGRYDEAMPHFEQAIAQARQPQARPVQDLHYYAGDTLGRLERQHDAEAAFAEELRLFPLTVRARAGLATLYQATDRRDAAEAMVREMLSIAPVPDTYAFAARFFTTLGRRQEAEAVRADSRRAAKY